MVPGVPTTIGVGTPTVAEGTSVARAVKVASIGESVGVRG